MVGQGTRMDKERERRDGEIMRQEVKKNEGTKGEEGIKKC